MQPKKNRDIQSNNLFALRVSGASPLSNDSEAIPTVPLDLKNEFKQWSRANRILSRHWVIAERLGGRALRSVRWERGMIMLRGVHIELALRKVGSR